MSAVSRIGMKFRLSATVLLVSWLLVRLAAGSGQDATVDLSYNPLRSGERPWSRDQSFLISVRNTSQPTRPSDVSRAGIQKAIVPRPQQTATPPPTSPTDSVDARPQAYVAARILIEPGVASTISTKGVIRTSIAQAPSVASPAPSTPTTVEPRQPAASEGLPEWSPSDVPAPTTAEPRQPVASEGAPEWLPSDVSALNGSIAAEEDTMLTGLQPQSWLPCEPAFRCGVACPNGGCPIVDHRWLGMRPQMIPWQVFAQGEYVGPARLAHVPEYRLRVDDIIRLIYGLTGEPSPRPYRLEVGDVLEIESIGDPTIDRTVIVQPDGMATMRLLGQVRAAGFDLDEFRKDLESRYLRYVREPAISVTPVKVNSRVEELRSAVDQRYGEGGQGLEVRVTPEGTVQLPSIGSLPVQGLTLDEVKREIEARYARRFHGVEVTPILEQRAPRYLFVLGEVRNPGRYELEGPTTAMQAIAMAGGWNVGAKLRQVVVFRRDERWRLMATRLHLRGAVRGTRPCPADEIWLRDSDVLLVPKSPLLETDDAIELLFTRGLYGVFPVTGSVSWISSSRLPEL